MAFVDSTMWLFSILTGPVKWVLATVFGLRWRPGHLIHGEKLPVDAKVYIGRRLWGKVALNGNLPSMLLAVGNHDVRVQFKGQNGAVEYKAVIEITRADSWVDLDLDSFVLSS